MCKAGANIKVNGSEAADIAEKEATGMVGTASTKLPYTDKYPTFRRSKNCNNKKWEKQY